MSITSTITSGPYTGNGSQTAFAFSFTALSKDDVSVLVDGAAVSSTTYTVSIASGGNSGTVTFLAAPASGAQVSIIQNPDFLQDSQFANQAAYSLTSVNSINRRATQRSNYLKRAFSDFLGLIGVAGYPALEQLAASRVRQVDTFAALATATPAAGEVVFAKGYTTAGDGGHGYYVADALATSALVTAHPRLASNTATTGVRVRAMALGNELNVRQAGAKATAGQNDQPAIQAAIDYAIALGIPAIRLCATHECWQPALPSGTPNALAGAVMFITGDVDILGVDGMTTLNLKNSTGGQKLKTDGSGTWEAAFCTYYGSGVTRSVLRNFKVVTGTAFTNVMVNTEWNDHQKGIQMNEAHCPNLVLVDHRNIELRKFAGEIWYMGGSFANASVYLENVVLEESPQSCWNPGSLADVTAVNLQAGISYQPAEIIARNMNLRGCRFYTGTAFVVIFTEAFSGSYAYSYPFMTASTPQYCTWSDCRFEQVTTIYLTCRNRGEIDVIDGTVTFLNYGRTSDNKLRINATLDQSSNIMAVDWNCQPATTTTQVTSAPVGIYYETPRNNHIEVICQRSNDARADGRKWITAVNLRGGKCDYSTCTFKVGGELIYATSRVADMYGTPASASEFPLVLWDQDQAYPHQSLYASAPSADFTYNLDEVTHAGINPQASGTFLMTYTNTNNFVFAQGQVLRISHNGATNNNTRQIKIPPQTGLAMKSARILYYPGDYVDLAWDALGTTWVEIAYVSRQAAQAIFQTPATNAATITPRYDDDHIDIYAHTVNMTIANATAGTIIHRKPMKIYIRDNGTARTIAYGTQYRSVCATALPATTVINKRILLTGEWNAIDSKFDIYDVAQEP